MKIIQMDAGACNAATEMKECNIPGAANGLDGSPPPPFEHSNMPVEE
ncbi:MAG: hypothetical protein O8C66_06670 [Candidatus Methanoperedens sp.]|nr:hypothetical protein [Candidatus Methanoperedens sp.]MCZ7370175.1 hypothetical protein [Candidatus Methanoperedens sp.]